MGAYILAVDDEAHIRRLVQINLQRAGHRVDTAADGVEALERIQVERPDMLVLDVTMPRLDGIELLRRLKADPETAGIRVVMLTARAQDADIFEGERSGADLYLCKPFSPVQLMQAVKDILGS